MLLGLGIFLMGFGLAGFLHTVYEIYTLWNPSKGKK